MLLIRDRILLVWDRILLMLDRIVVILRIMDRTFDFADSGSDVVDPG